MGAKSSRQITLNLNRIQKTDISFPRSRKGSSKPVKTLWKSTMGVQSDRTLPTVKTYASRVGVARAWVVSGQELYPNNIRTQHVLEDEPNNSNNNNNY